MPKQPSTIERLWRDGRFKDVNRGLAADAKFAASGEITCAACGTAYYNAAGCGLCPGCGTRNCGDEGRS